MTAGGIEENVSRFTGVGICGDEAIVEAKFTLRHFNLADEDPRMAAIDGEVVEAMRQRWVLLYPAGEGDGIRTNGIKPACGRPKGICQGDERYGNESERNF